MHFVNYNLTLPGGDFMRFCVIFREGFSGDRLKKKKILTNEQNRVIIKVSLYPHVPLYGTAVCGNEFILT